MTRPRWQQATGPEPPSGDAEAVWVDDATITPVRTGRMRVADRDWKWVTGAVYDGAGDLVPQSQRLWARDAFQPAAVDADRVRPAKNAQALDGRWLFGGHWTQHFGHFLVETLTNLWPPSGRDTDGIVALRSAYAPTPAYGGRGLRDAELNSWQRQLLELAGLGGHRVVISRHKPVRVERLLVPERPVLVKHWARPEAVRLWQRMSDAVGERGAARKVFFSRSRFNSVAAGARRTEASWDALLDASFAEAGFEVVHPEDLSIPAQIALVRGAEVFAGSSGSALHLSCFASPGTKVVEVGDRRSGRRSLPTQRAIDAACGHLTAFLPYDDREALAELTRIDDWPMVTDEDADGDVAETRRSWSTRLRSAGLRSARLTSAVRRVRG